jgi:hypothetical protein
MATLRYAFYVGLIAVMAAAAFPQDASALLTPACQIKGKWVSPGTSCGPPSLHMTCQRQGQGDRLVCRKDPSAN